MEKNRKNVNGITLIALVLTIIVLLILASVSIAMLTGENGILRQTSNAKENTTKAEEEEKIKLAVVGSSINDDGLVEVLDETSFRNELKNQFASQELDVVVNGDGSFIIEIKDTNRKYYVNDDKTVINSDNIIEINNEEELKTFRDDVNSGNSYEGKVVLLTSDINLTGEEWEAIGYYDQATEDVKYPDTENNKPFKGIFDGGNCKINGITISSDEICNGLFGLVIDGTIRNIIIEENNSINGNQRTAGVVGYLYGTTGNISNCINYADIKGEETTGGIVGVVAGKHRIFNCKNYGDIKGRGGIVGNSNGTNWEQFTKYYSEIINCGNYGEITSEPNENYYGGIAGYFNGNIINSCNKGNVNGSYWNTGGIVGSLDGKIENCYNLGDVKGEKEAGGIIGAGGETDGTYVTNCYSIGNILGKSSGEIIGSYYKINKITNSYTKNDTFTATDLGKAFKEDSEGINNGYPLLYWE